MRTSDQGLELRVTVLGQNGATALGRRLAVGEMVSRTIGRDERDVDPVEISFQGCRAVVEIDLTPARPVVAPRTPAATSEADFTVYAEPIRPVAKPFVPRTPAATSEADLGGAHDDESSDGGIAHDYRARPISDCSDVASDGAELEPEAKRPRTVSSSLSSAAPSDAAQSALAAPLAHVRALGVDLVGLAASTIVFAQRATIPTSEVVALVLAEAPALLEPPEASTWAWTAVIENVLNEGPFGCINNDGLRVRPLHLAHLTA